MRIIPAITLLCYVYNVFIDSNLPSVWSNDVVFVQFLLARIFRESLLCRLGDIELLYQVNGVLVFVHHAIYGSSFFRDFFSGWPDLDPFYAAIVFSKCFLYNALKQLEVSEVTILALWATLVEVHLPLRILESRLLAFTKLYTLFLDYRGCDLDVYLLLAVSLALILQLLHATYLSSFPVQHRLAHLISLPYTTLSQVSSLSVSIHLSIPVNHHLCFDFLFIVNIVTQSNLLFLASESSSYLIHGNPGLTTMYLSLRRYFAHAAKIARNALCKKSVVLDDCLSRLRVKKVKQEKDGIEFKIEKFDKASKDLDQLLGSQRTDKSKKGLGYSAVPPPHPLIYNRPKKLDLSYSDLDEFKELSSEGFWSWEEE
ncbi:hypothetical protein Tco_0378097 [Tanacetum coccineum]